jgi:hypothetical protein
MVTTTPNSQSAPVRPVKILGFLFGCDAFFFFGIYFSFLVIFFSPNKFLYCAVTFVDRLSRDGNRCNSAEKEKQFFVLMILNGNPFGWAWASH